MGNRNSIQESVSHIEEMKEFDDEELSKKDKAFQTCILELYEEIRKVKESKSDKILYKLPEVNPTRWFNDIIFDLKNNIIEYLGSHPLFPIWFFTKIKRGYWRHRQ